MAGDYLQEQRKEALTMLFTHMLDVSVCVHCVLYVRMWMWVYVIRKSE